MDNGTEEIVYDESVRAISRQEAALDGLRTRTGALLAAAALATGFIGGQALSRRPAITWDGWLAIGFFVAMAVLSLAILWPWTWVFSVSARVLVREHVDVPERNHRGLLQLFLAQAIEENWDANQRKLDWLNICFRGATICLVAEVFVWLLVLGR